MVHIAVPCPDLLSPVYTGGYVARICICWHLEMCNREQTVYTTPLGVKGYHVNLWLVVTVWSVSPPISHTSEDLSSLLTYTLRQSKMHPTVKLNWTSRGKLCLEDVSACLCVWICICVYFNSNDGLFLVSNYVPDCALPYSRGVKRKDPSFKTLQKF